jgi:cadherin-like protein
MSFKRTARARIQQGLQGRGRLVASLAVAAALVGAFGGSVARAALPTAAVYDAVPGVLPPNMPSLGFQATQTSELGDYVHLAGTNRVLGTVTVTMSDWALHSDYPSLDSSGWTHPITLNVYDSGTPLGPGALLRTMTRTFTIPWRPAADPTCAGGTAWRASDGQCYNGVAFTVAFDLGSSLTTLSDDVVVSVAYNTQSYGANPLGAAGPYNSLNVGLRGSASIGADDNADNLFWRTSTAGSYADHGVGGVGTLREDSDWSPNGTLPIRITAAPLAPDDAYVNAAWASVPSGSDPDGSDAAGQMGYDAFATIQDALDAVAAGGTVHVAAGVYPENLTVAKSVALKGAARTATITGSMSITAPNVTVDGFTLTNPTGTNAVTVSGVSGARITNNDIRNIGGSGTTVNATGPVQAIYVLANNAVDVSGIVISGNSISHVRSSGVGSGKSIKAIFVGDSTGATNVSATITANTLTDIVSSGWGAYGILVNHGTHGSGSSSVDIESNTIGTLSGTYVHAIGLEGDTPHARVIGNRIGNLIDSTPLPAPDTEALRFEDNPHAGQATVTGNSWAGGASFGIVVAGSAVGPVTAAGNWWGSSAAADVLSHSVGSVIARPWCVDSTCSILSDNTDLMSLSVSGATLSPGFSGSTSNYNVSVGNGVSAVTVDATAHAGAVVAIDGGATLHTGENTVTVSVTAADGATKAYTVVVDRAAAAASGGAARSSNADLAGLSLSSGTLAPGFTPSTTSYYASVGNSVTTISVSATAAGPGAGVSTSGGSALNVGGNTLTVKVTAADGAVKMYTVTVVRAAAPVVVGSPLRDTQAPAKPTVKASVRGRNLYLRIRSWDNLALAFYLTSFNGHVVSRSAHGNVVLAIGRPVAVRVTAVDEAGNKSKPSARISIVRTGDRSHPFKLAG